MLRITAAERRRRLVIRHHLGRATPTRDVLHATRDLVALHATDPATVFMSLWARVRDVTPADIERALYQDRSLVRLMAMRRTLFVVPVELAPAVQAACAPEIATRTRAQLVERLGRTGIASPAAELRDIERSTLAILEKAGEATGAELSAREPRLRHRLDLPEMKRYGPAPSITSTVLVLLGLEGRVVRGRPKGTWASGQFYWAPAARWLGDRIDDMDVHRARTEIVRAWLSRFGPATFADVRWWTGWTVRAVRQALEPLRPLEVDLDGAAGLVLPGDTAKAQPARPSVALLPGLDPTIMGWAGRDWYLGDHGRTLFDRSGNAGPSIWYGGRVIGGWVQRRDGGEIVFRLFEDVGREVERAVGAEAERLRRWLGAVTVTPRFRTPLERELSR